MIRSKGVCTLKKVTFTKYKIKIIFERKSDWDLEKNRMEDKIERAFLHENYAIMVNI